MRCAGQLDYPVYHGAAAGGGGTKRGHPFTLYKLPAATGFTTDLSGATKYIDLCTAAIAEVPVVDVISSPHMRHKVVPTTCNELHPRHVTTSRCL